MAVSFFCVRTNRINKKRPRVRIQVTDPQPTRGPELIIIQNKLSCQALCKIQASRRGNKFVQTLSKDLRMEYPSATGYSERNLNYMRQFAERIPTEEILQQGVTKINWRSITFLINQTNNTEEFVWYARQTLEQGWSSTVLRHQIESGLYDRQVLVEKTTNYKTQLANPLGEQAEEIIKDPYVFDFIPAAAPLLEKDLEDAMVSQITRVLMEFGSGFSFLGRQYPIHVGDDMNKTQQGEIRGYISLLQSRIEPLIEQAGIDPVNADRLINTLLCMFPGVGSLKAVTIEGSVCRCPGWIITPAFLAYTKIDD